MRSSRNSDTSVVLFSNVLWWSLLLACTSDVNAEHKNTSSHLHDLNNNAKYEYLRTSVVGHRVCFTQTLTVFFWFCSELSAHSCQPPPWDPRVDILCTEGFTRADQTSVIKQPSTIKCLLSQSYYLKGNLITGELIGKGRKVGGRKIKLFVAVQAEGFDQLLDALASLPGVKGLTAILEEIRQSTFPYLSSFPFSSLQRHTRHTADRLFMCSTFAFINFIWSGYIQKSLKGTPLQSGLGFELWIFFRWQQVWLCWKKTSIERKWQQSCPVQTLHDVLLAVVRSCPRWTVLVWIFNWGVTTNFLNTRVCRHKDRNTPWMACWRQTKQSKTWSACYCFPRALRIFCCRQWVEVQRQQHILALYVLSDVSQNVRCFVFGLRTFGFEWPICGVILAD